MLRGTYSYLVVDQVFLWINLFKRRTEAIAEAFHMVCYQLLGYWFLGFSAHTKILLQSSEDATASLMSSLKHVDGEIRFKASSIASVWVSLAENSFLKNCWTHLLSWNENLVSDYRKIEARG